MGYIAVLWSLNSKDWMTFDDQYMVAYLMRKIKPGDRGHFPLELVPDCSPFVLGMGNET
jgi:hypothetical protein